MSQYLSDPACLTLTPRAALLAKAKRTNVGIALVGEPRVLFLDEPTSGLDSYTASEVMQVVKVCCHWCLCLPVDPV